MKIPREKITKKLYNVFCKLIYVNFVNKKFNRLLPLKNGMGAKFNHLPMYILFSGSYNKQRFSNQKIILNLRFLCIFLNETHKLKRFKTLLK